MIARAFLKPIGRILFEQRGKSSSINSTRYAELYPQNVEHIAIVDSAMTSFHRICISILSIGKRLTRKFALRHSFCIETRPVAGQVQLSRRC